MSFESDIPSVFLHGDQITYDGRPGTFFRDSGPASGDFAVVMFDRGDGVEDGLGVPWSGLTGTGFWRCYCPRLWMIATAPFLRCDKCGACRG